MKKAILFGLIFAMVLSLCACNTKKINGQSDTELVITESIKQNNTAEGSIVQSSTEQELSKAEGAPEVQSISIISFPKTYNDTVNGIVFETSIEIPDTFDFSAIKRSTAVRQFVDLEATKNFFSESKEIVEERFDDYAEPEVDEWSGEFSDSSMLSIGLVFGYGTTLSRQIDERFLAYENGSRFSKTNQLTTITPEIALNKFEEYMRLFNCDVGEYNYSYYLIDHQTIQGITVDTISDSPMGSYNWSTEDDAYYFYIEQKYQDLPVYFGIENFPQDYEYYRPLQMIYSQRGLEKLYMLSTYTFSESEEPIQLLDFSEVVSLVSNKYGNLLTNASYVVNRAKLYQMPVVNATGDYDLKIAWLVEITESGIDVELDGEPYDYTFYISVNAETGEEILL